MSHYLSGNKLYPGCKGNAAFVVLRWWEFLMMSNRLCKNVQVTKTYIRVQKGNQYQAHIKHKCYCSV